MEPDFPFVEVSKADRTIVGEPDSQTRIYRQEGSEEECADWFEFVHERWRPTVSPGGVSMFLPVSRAAVHKRLKAGKLTAFLYHVTHRERTFFGRDRAVKAQPYVYIPVSECKAWAAEVALRPENFDNFIESVREEDFNQEFIDFDPKDKGNRNVRSELQVTLGEAIKLLFGK